MTPLLISLVVLPAFAPAGTAPTLSIRVNTEKNEPVAFSWPVDDLCFIELMLDASLINPAKKELARAKCASSSIEWVQVIAPIERKLELSKLFPTAKWTSGAWAFEFNWKRDADAGVKVKQVHLRNQRIVRAKPLGSLTVKVKTSVTLADGAQLNFRANGHKDTEPGQESPLIIRGSFAAPGKKLEAFDVNVFTSKDRSFELEGHVFELLEYAYDESMTLRYYGKVPFFTE